MLLLLYLFLRPLCYSRYTAYSVALAYVVKLVGPVLVGRQAYVQFAFLMKAGFRGLGFGLMGV